MGLYAVFMEQLLILGKSNTGKSTVIKKRVLDDIHAGDGLIFLDFYGSHINEVLHHIPDNRKDDVVFFNASDKTNVTAFNIFDDVVPDDRPLVASSVLSAFKSITGYTINTPVLDRVLYNSARLVLDNNGTLLSMFYLLTKNEYRESLLKHCIDLTIKDFWIDYGHLSVKDKKDMNSSTLSNMEPFITDSTLRNVIGQSTSSFSIKDIMSDKKILLVALSTHLLGDKARLLGFLLLTSIYTSARHNTDPFTVYVDGAQHVTSPLLLRLMTDLSTFNIGTAITFQNLNQMKDIPYLDAFTSLLAFNLGVNDSKTLHKVFSMGDQEIRLDELLPYDGLLLKGLHRKDFKCTPHSYSQLPTADRLVNRCINDYSTHRDIVEKKINNFIRRL